MKSVMVRAWEIAKEAVKKFGGNVKSFFSQSLKFAWSELKGGSKMVELKGSEKQVKWALDLRTKLVDLINSYLSVDVEQLDKAAQTIEALSKLKADVESQEQSKWFIDNRDLITTCQELDENKNLIDIELLNVDTAKLDLREIYGIKNRGFKIVSRARLLKVYNFKSI